MQYCPTEANLIDSRIFLKKNMEANGCSHYPRKCKILAPCCKIWYPCRLCHNDQYKGPKAGGCQIEVMDRRAVSKIKCLICEEEQEASNKCQKCGVEFACYYCPICKLWDDTPDKQIYHCEKCGICRIGDINTNFHCDNCSADFPSTGKDSHKCTKQNMVTNCPICFEDLFSSREPAIPLNKCGHFIHAHCLKSYIKKSKSNRCPLCFKSIYDEDPEYIEELDQIIESTRENLPPELKEKKVNALCNDCLQRSEGILFHFLGLKCAGCGSYNTREVP